MSTELIINATLPETRIALLENGEIQELHIERDSERGIVGNIYKGKVIRVLPGMQAAFVDIGLEKAAFLYVDDIFFPDMKNPLSTNPLPDPKALAARANPRTIKIDRLAKPHARPQFGGGPRGKTPLPGTPEAHDMMQREYAKQMLDLDADDEAGLAPKPASELPTVASEEEYLQKTADQKNEELGLDASVNEIPGAEEASRGEASHLQGADPQDYTESTNEEQPVARSAEGEAETELDDEDEEQFSSPDLISRSEPQIDPDAWVEDVVQSHTDDGDEINAAELPSSEEVSHESGLPPEPGFDADVPEEILGADENNIEDAPSSHTHSDESEMPRRRRRREQVNIADLVREGQEILVQVAKDPIGTKGARLTCHISLPGRYLVFMPTVDHIGVSRRIESDGDRRRLKETISRIRPAKTGVIVRTASGNQTDQNLKSDLDYLVETWNEIQKKFTKQKVPSPVYQDLTIVLRAIRDMFTDEVDKVIVDSKREHKAIMKFVSRFIPQVKNKVDLYTGAMPIFDHYGIETEISKAMDRKVWLKSGGYLVVDQAEALVAIDVNTGRYVGKKTLEETILKTNLEAVKEIAYQLRLRNCGGIIILDLIDMDKEASREKVYKALEEALKKDRARPTIMKISQLGLIEMTRKRTRDSMVRSMCEPCSYCEGRGFVRNKLTLAYDIMRDVEREIQNTDLQGISIQCHPSVADILLEDKRDVMEDLERQYSKRITVRSNGAYHAEQYELVAQMTEKNITWSSDERKQLVKQRIYEHLQKQAQEVRKKTNTEKADRKKEQIEKRKAAADQRRKAQEERRRQAQQQKMNRSKMQQEEGQGIASEEVQNVAAGQDTSLEGLDAENRSQAPVVERERTKIVINREKKVVPEGEAPRISVEPIDPDQVGNRGPAPIKVNPTTPSLYDEDEDGPQPLVDPTGRPLSGNNKNTGYFSNYQQEQTLTIHSIGKGLGEGRHSGDRSGGGHRHGGGRHQGGQPVGQSRRPNNNNRNRNKQNRFGSGGGGQGGQPRFGGNQPQHRHPQHQANSQDPESRGNQSEGNASGGGEPRNNRGRHHRNNRNRFRKGQGHKPQQRGGGGPGNSQPRVDTVNKITRDNSSGEGSSGGGGESGSSTD